MPFFNKKNLVFGILAIVIIAGAGFGFGFWYGQKHVVCKTCKPETVDFSLFWQAWQTLEKNFVDPQKFDTQKMIYGAISGMVNSLGDPYTTFFSPQDSKKFLEDVSGSFEGVGMEIGSKKGQLQVIAPLDGTPAQRAGLRAGDKILKIDGTSTADLSVEEAVNFIRGPRGSEVTLTIIRNSWDASKDFKITRDVIQVPSLSWKLMPVTGKTGAGTEQIAYIKIDQFSETAASDFSKAALEIINSPAKKIVLDLRNNPGGYLEVSQNIAGWFLAEGQTVTVEDFGGKQPQNYYKAQGSAKFVNYPIVVLMNEGTASAAEILAGALRDNRQIKLIGEKSFGKGSVQELKDLTGGSTLKVTIAHWLTPKGNLIADKGLDPDVTVKMTEDDYSNNRDPQLDKALEMIKSL